ncbi:MAG: alkaline phosphatase [Opitutales bacterium]
MMTRERLMGLVAAFSITFVLTGCESTPDGGKSAGGVSGSAIFIHPDGSSLSMWDAHRIYTVGPDGLSAWDKLPEMAAYRGHMKDALASTSHGGATVHAYGRKVPADSYGLHGTEPLVALSGFDGSIMMEAQARGKAIGLVNSGHVGEPGTGVFLARSPRRGDINLIAKQVLRSGAEVLLFAGEKWMLPQGTVGFHGVEGVREDGLNLIAEAREAGYTVVFTREQLMAVDTSNTDKLLGVFGPEDTYNDQSEEDLADQGLPLFQEYAPTVAEMVDVALQILGRSPEGFLLVMEEEATDNFGNHNNAKGTFQALAHADAAIAIAADYVAKHPDTLLITAADSDAGSMALLSPPAAYGNFPEGVPLPESTRNGAALDGIDGTGTPPFVSAPDQFGERITFGIAWAGFADFNGGIVSRAAGAHSDQLTNVVDNTDIYRLLYLALFGEELD